MCISNPGLSPQLQASIAKIQHLPLISNGRLNLIMPKPELPRSPFPKTSSVLAFLISDDAMSVLSVVQTPNLRVKLIYSLMCDIRSIRKSCCLPSKWIPKLYGYHVYHYHGAASMVISFLNCYNRSLPTVVTVARMIIHKWKQ